MTHQQMEQILNTAFTVVMARQDAKQAAQRGAKAKDAPTYPEGSRGVWWGDL